ncbi:uncharacterized protein N0V89_005243 [Didymosphaeria variabile]|uniref:Uncharacterized protein n=1 Tax=Didymosphaeria variabile TaxID=1932322 RepID=A0A9W9CBK1_9PLEO|nr:uncharacterized protein N0V89_005243 [Didymosphaeria variabile]KAJ4353513.1 hypothetical protein N0V89_005243 [Didymosphaeria variabile]
MASPSLPPSSTASPFYHPSLENIFEALDELLKHGLGRNDIAILLKLGSAGVGRILDLLEHKGRPAVDNLLGSLEGVSEATLGRLINPRDAATNEQSERGRQPSINRPRSPIDNKNSYAFTATPPALATYQTTPYLRPPLPAHNSLPRSNSTRTRSVSSKGSSSTNITHPSSHSRVEKKKVLSKPPSKPARKQLYCPDCKKDIKNGFDKHFRKHLDDLVGPYEADFEVHEAFGCGYCHAQGVLVEGGKVFHGVAELVHHVKDVHASTPQKLDWNISHSFNHILSAQPHFRRKIVGMIVDYSRKSGNHNTIPSLSWGPDHRQLLRNLQIVSGRLDKNPSCYKDEAIDTILTQVYEAASQNWQQPFAFSSQPTPQHAVPMGPLQQSIPHHPRHKSTPDMSFAGIGGGFPDTPTPKHHSFTGDVRSPSILSPSPQVPQIPQHIERSIRHPQSVNIMDQDAPSYHAGLIPHDPPPTIAFDGLASYSTPPPSQGLQLDSMQGLYTDLQIDERDLYNS